MPPPRPPSRRPAGCAGTGKSLLLRHMLRCLPGGTTFVTGTTGLAACHLGGTTINSYAGIGRAEGSIGLWLRFEGGIDEAAAKRSLPCAIGTLYIVSN